MSRSEIKSELPWQLKVFRRSIKKQLKVEALLRILGDLSGQNCLLVTCGDNNGALNWFFRAHGGSWTWGEFDSENLAQMEALLGEPVQHLLPDRFPFEQDHFDCVVSIDVLEHLEDDHPVLLELKRVLRPEGRLIITVPNGDPKLLANRIKWRLGMTPEVYGHTRAGYTLTELGDAITRAGFNPGSQGGYSRFFTEMVELAINYGYVFVLARKKGGEVKAQIAPSTYGELKTYGTAYRLYSLAFPVMKLMSRLDGLLPASNNNAVILEGFKPGVKA